MLRLRPALREILPSGSKVHLSHSLQQRLSLGVTATAAHPSPLFRLPPLYLLLTALTGQVMVPSLYRPNRSRELLVRIMWALPLTQAVVSLMTKWLSDTTMSRICTSLHLPPLPLHLRNRPRTPLPRSKVLSDHRATRHRTNPVMANHRPPLQLRMDGPHRALGNRHLLHSSPPHLPRNNSNRTEPSNTATPPNKITTKPMACSGTDHTAPLKGTINSNNSSSSNTLSLRLIVLLLLNLSLNPSHNSSRRCLLLQVLTLTMAALFYSTVRLFGICCTKFLLMLLYSDRDV